MSDPIDQILQDSAKATSLVLASNFRAVGVMHLSLPQLQVSLVTDES